LVLFHNYFWPRPWPQPPEIGLGLEVLASFNITVTYLLTRCAHINVLPAILLVNFSFPNCWPRQTSLDFCTLTWC